MYAAPDHPYDVLSPCPVRNISLTLCRINSEFLQHYPPPTIPPGPLPLWRGSRRYLLWLLYTACGMQIIQPVECRLKTFLSYTSVCVCVCVFLLCMVFGTKEEAQVSSTCSHGLMNWILKKAEFNTSMLEVLACLSACHLTNEGQQDNQNFPRKLRGSCSPELKSL